MRARCGRCSTEVDVVGDGRFKCPTCGAINQVPGQPGSEASAGAPNSGQPGANEPPVVPVPPPAPSPRLSCTECGFSFIVGAVEVAVCPNCNADVPVGPSPDDD